LKEDEIMDELKNIRKFYKDPVNILGTIAIVTLIIALFLPWILGSIEKVKTVIG